MPDRALASSFEERLGKPNRYTLVIHQRRQNLVRRHQFTMDCPRLDARMHSEYLRKLILNNDLAEGHYHAGDTAIAVSDIRAPIFAVGTEDDHVAPWHIRDVTMRALDGKVALVVGVANAHSIAAGCAQAFADAGAKVALTYVNETPNPMCSPSPMLWAPSCCSRSTSKQRMRWRPFSRPSKTNGGGSIFWSTRSRSVRQMTYTGASPIVRAPDLRAPWTSRSIR